MLCCLGLFAGITVGSALGGPWTLIAPAAGFGLGFIGDMKLMRGMHKSHGNHGGGCHGGGNREHEPSSEGFTGVRDPVCGMTVNTDVGSQTAEFQGSTYYFCSAACKSAFQKNPERYLT